MLKVLFGWLDAHPNFYWAVVAVPTSALTAIVAANLWRRRGQADASKSDLSFILVSIAALVAWRWPALLESREFNPDESQLIAGAITLTHDPVFWRSVDGTTSGPLNFYALLPFRALALPLDYFTARLVGLTLISVALVACYRLLRSFAEPAPAQLAMFPLLMFFATTTDPFFLEYSSGDVSVALFAVSAFLLFRQNSGGRSPSRGQLFGAFICGMLPWAKLQSAPLSAALVAGALGLIVSENSRSLHARTRLCCAIVLAAAVPTIAGLLLIISTGQFEPFVQGYLKQNFVYVGNDQSIASAVSGMWKFVSITQVFPVFFGVSLGILALSFGIYLVRRQRVGRLFLPAVACVFAAIFCVLVPRRPFAHYLLLIVIPLALLVGVVLGELWRAAHFRRSLALFLLALGCLAPLSMRLRHPVPQQFGNFSENWRRPYSLAGTLLRSSRIPGDMLAVWGWRTDLYVDGQMAQATRDPHTVWSIETAPNQAYYRERFLADMARSRPAFFVDAVGPGAVFYRDRSTLAHESVPALATYVDREYALIADLQSERIYLRKDLRTDARRDFSESALQRILSKARPVAPVEVDAPPPESVVPSTLGAWDLDGQSVRMLLPPARLAWVLDGTEIEASVAFGFYPRAYLEGKSNGADFLVDFETDGAPPQNLFKRHLDPARSRNDRGMLFTRIALPKHSEGPRLVIRTEPGEFGDQAWDWVYLADLRYVRRTLWLFPGFGPG